MTTLCCLLISLGIDLESYPLSKSWDACNKRQVRERKEKLFNSRLYSVCLASTLAKCDVHCCFVSSRDFFLSVCVGNIVTVSFAHILQIIIFLHVFNNGT